MNNSSSIKTTTANLLEKNLTANDSAKNSKHRLLSDIISDFKESDMADEYIDYTEGTEKKSNKNKTSVSKLRKTNTDDC
jgi:hypothetical protein